MAACRFPLVALVFLSSLYTAFAEDPERVRDEQILREAGIAFDGPALLSYFRKRSISDEQRQQILDLIRKTGDESFAVRRKGSADLEALGLTAISLLRQ